MRRFTKESTQNITSTRENMTEGVAYLLAGDMDDFGMFMQLRLGKQEVRAYLRPKMMRLPQTGITLRHDVTTPFGIGVQTIMHERYQHLLQLNLEKCQLANAKWEEPKGGLVIKAINKMALVPDAYGFGMDVKQYLEYRCDMHELSMVSSMMFKNFFEYGKAQLSSVKGTSSLVDVIDELIGMQQGFTYALKGYQAKSVQLCNWLYGADLVVESK